MRKPVKRKGKKKKHRKSQKRQNTKTANIPVWDIKEPERTKEIDDTIHNITRLFPEKYKLVLVGKSEASVFTKRNSEMEKPTYVTLQYK